MNLLKIVNTFFDKRIKTWITVSIFASFIIGIIEVAIAILLQYFLSSIGLLKIDANPFGLLAENVTTNTFLVLLIIVGLVRFIFSILNQHGSNYVLELINLKFKSISVINLFSKNDNSLTNYSDVHYQLSELSPKFSHFTSCFINFISYIIQSLVILTFMIKLSITCVFFSFLGMIVIGIIVIFINKKVKNVAKKIPYEMFKLNTGIERISKNIFFINVMKKHEIEKNILLNSLQKYASLTTKSSFLNIFSTTLTSFLGIILLVVIIYAGIYLYPVPSIILLSFIYLFIRFVQNISASLGALGQITTYYEQFKLSIDFFDKINLKNLNHQAKLNFFGSSIKNKISYNNSNIYINSLNNDKINSPNIEIKDLKYFYTNKEKPIFNEFNLSVKSGSQCAIIGSSGTGKSTLLSLILGLHQPNQGQILINGKNPQAFFSNPENRIGYVGSEPFLICGTILENLAYGVSRSISYEEIEEALSLAKIDKFIKEIGLEYCIGEDQTGLSTGQKQRICLARALLNKPCILILDEVSANLDLNTELEIAESLKSIKNYCTILLVSHRDGIIKYADEIVKL